jgi:serine/threonine protein kinase
MVHSAQFFIHFSIVVNVVRLLGLCTTPELCIVTEYMPKGSLYSYLRANKYIDDRVKLEWIKGIAAGMVNTSFSDHTYFTDTQPKVAPSHRESHSQGSSC